MPKNKQQKNEELAALTSSLQGSDSFVLAKFQGLKVKDADAMRKEMREAGVSFTVIKRTLLKRALESKRAEIPGIMEEREAVGIAVASEDILAPAKLISAFAKKNEALSVIAGWLSGKAMSPAEVKALAALPGKKELQGQLVGVLSGPARGLVSLMGGTMRGFVQVLKAKAEKN